MGTFKEKHLKKSDQIKPVTLAQLDEQSLHIFCWCNRCGHNAELPPAPLIDRLGPLFPVPELGVHMRCSHCGTQDVATRPAWPAYGGQIARHG
jgi:ribosomal protein L37E